MVLVGTLLDLLRKGMAQVRHQWRHRQVELITGRYRARLKGKAAQADEIVGYDEHGLPM